MLAMMLENGSETINTNADGRFEKTKNRLFYQRKTFKFWSQTFAV